MRNTSRDGLLNTLEFTFLRNFALFWAVVQRIDWLARQANRRLINRAICRLGTRPRPLTTLGSYTSWECLTDRRWYGRHLPPETRKRDLPPAEDVAKLFERRPDRGILSETSTLLFAYFAQWFTDGFLRTDPEDSLKTASNHEIDLSQLYGLNPAATTLIRSHHGGRLKSQIIGGEEYPLYYFADGRVRPEFEGLKLILPPKGKELPAARLHELFAMGGDRSNVMVGHVMLNVLFLREHNRICRELQAAYPDWDDERLFQTARNILTAVLLRIVIEEYVNHIAPFRFQFFVDPTVSRNANWNRQNWISIEFNLLYRWHSLMPDTVRFAGRSMPVQETRWTTGLLVKHGLARLFEDASLQPAGQIGLFNTPAFLSQVEVASIRMGRSAQLRGYNDYREYCGFPRVTGFDQITGNREVQHALKALYGHVDSIEFYVGLFAEDRQPESMIGPLIGRMVAADAFSQALTNPLLAETVYNPDTFSPVGMRIIETTRTLSDLLHRNVPQTSQRFKVSMTRHS